MGVPARRVRALAARGIHSLTYVPTTTYDNLDHSLDIRFHVRYKYGMAARAPFDPWLGRTVSMTPGE